MKKLTELLAIEVTFGVPIWFPPDRLEYSTTVLYDKNHAYAGSYKETRYGNTAEDALFKQFDCKELCKYCWVSFELDPECNLLAEIEKIQGKLERFLKRYKEAKK